MFILNQTAVSSVRPASLCNERYTRMESPEQCLLSDSELFSDLIQLAFLRSTTFNKHFKNPALCGNSSIDRGGGKHHFHKRKQNNYILLITTAMIQITSTVPLIHLSFPFNSDYSGGSRYIPWGLINLTHIFTKEENCCLCLVCLEISTGISLH